MILLILGLFLICAADPPPNRANAKQFLASFKDAVAIPFSTSFLSKDQMMSKIFEVGRKAIPYADLLAKFVKVGLDQDDSKAIMDVVEGVQDTLNVLQGQIDAVFNGVKELKLVSNFKNVQNQVKIFLKKFGTFLKNTQSDAETKLLANYCYDHNTGMIVDLISFSQLCTNVTINFEASSFLHKVIYGYKFSKYKLDEEEELKFNSDYFTIYSYLNEDMDGYGKKIEAFMAADKSRHMPSKMVLLRKIIVSLNLDENREDPGSCLPLILFAKSNYERQAIQNFMLVVKGELHYIDFITTFCSRIVHPDDPVNHANYMDETQSEYPEVIQWMTVWADKVLNSTWPVLEMELINGFMKEAAEGEKIEENSDAYGEIIDYVRLKMHNIGHPGYERGYLMNREDTSFYKNSFYSICKEGHCNSTTTNSALCMVFRTDISHNTLELRVKKLARFTREIGPKVTAAMPKFKDDSPALVVPSLEYYNRIDLEDFTNHSSLAVMRYYRYSRGCETYFNKSTGSLNGIPFIQQFDYHYDGGYLEWCVHYTFFLAV